MVCEGISGGSYGVTPNLNSKQKGVPGFEKVLDRIKNGKRSDCGIPSRHRSVYADKSNGKVSVYQDSKSGETTYRYVENGHTVEAYDTDGDGNIDKYTIFGGYNTSTNKNNPNETYYSLTDSGNDDFFSWSNMGVEFKKDKN